MNEYIKGAILVFVLIMLVITAALFMTYVWPAETRTEIDGRVTKVVREGDYFNVTFNTGHGLIQKTVTAYVLEQIDGHDGRMLLGLTRHADSFIYKWDNVWYFSSIIKLDNYDGD